VSLPDRAGHIGGRTDGGAVVQGARAHPSHAEFGQFADRDAGDPSVFTGTPTFSVIPRRTPGSDAPGTNTPVRARSYVTGGAGQRRLRRRVLAEPVGVDASVHEQLPGSAV
jgi:hypothetical protein